MDINSLRHIESVKGSVRLGGNKYVFLNQGNQNYIVVPGLDSVSAAREAYSFVLNAINDGQLTTDKIVGIQLSGETTGKGNKQQFATAGLVNENIADIINTISKLHIAGWNGTSQVVCLNLTGAKGEVYTRDIKFYTHDFAEIPDMHFVEPDVKLFTLNSAGKKVSVEFLVATGYGAWDIDAVARHFHVREQSDVDYQDSDMFLNFIYINTVFNMTSGIRVLPVNISRDDILESYHDVVHYIDNKLYIPVVYSNGMTYQYFKDRLELALNYLDEKYNPYMSRSLASMIKKGGNT